MGAGIIRRAKGQIYAEQRRGPGRAIHSQRQGWNHTSTSILRGHLDDFTPVQQYLLSGSLI
jgi:hypothetical protein